MVVVVMVVMVVVVGSKGGRGGGGVLKLAIPIGEYKKVVKKWGILGIIITACSSSSSGVMSCHVMIESSSSPLN